ncbi:MAG TPA: hypothetical protein DE060_03020 [Lentisphaeria bacterium]|nr:hypothetical protein [Lentisphaeria bacterium]HCG48162.1 hypothetical protein [Lentisphaeria bacterium]
MRRFPHRRRSSLKILQFHCRNSTRVFRNIEGNDLQFAVYHGIVPYLNFLYFQMGGTNGT